jgi:hypothetical protein
MLLNQESEMKDKLLALFENVIGAFTMLVGFLFACYLAFIAAGLWGHLHVYALSAYK